MWAHRFANAEACARGALLRASIKGQLHLIPVSALLVPCSYLFKGSNP